MEAGGLCKGSSFGDQFKNILPEVADCETQTIGDVTYTTKGIFRRETLEVVF